MLKFINKIDSMGSVEMFYDDEEFCKFSLSPHGYAHIELDDLKLEDFKIITNGYIEMVNE